MPAPHRRNVGASLHEQISDHAAPRSIDSRRDRLVSARTRHAKKFEEVSEALERATGSDLEQRAEQARADYARARQLEHFESDVRRGRAKAPVVVLAPRAEPRYFLDCIDCEWTIWLHRPEPRVPLCPRCKDEREAKKVERRRSGS